LLMDGFRARLAGTKQQNLVITLEPDITVDNIEVTQFIYPMLHRERSASK
jgi:hypothetical protein